MTDLTSDTPPLELRRSYFDGREIILFDDGTWRFADGNLDFKAGTSAQQDFDFDLEHGAARFSLDPSVWTVSDVLKDQSVSNHQFQSADGFSVSVSYQFLGGHGGDIARNSGHKDRPLIGRLMAKVSEKVVAGILPEKQENVIGDVIVTESYFADAMTYDVHLMAVTEALSIELYLSDPDKRTDTSHDKEDRPIFDGRVAAFRENLHIGDTRLHDVRPSKPQSRKA